MEKRELAVSSETSWRDLCDMIEKLKIKRRGIDEAIVALQRIQLNHKRAKASYRPVLDEEREQVS
jgi:hypothetical protein